MLKFSLCIEPILEEYDFYDRIKVAKELGLDAIEFWDTAGKDVSKIGRLAAENNIDVSISCLKGAWTNRLNFPAKYVIENVRESIKLAKEMGCKSLIGLSGDVESKVDSQKNILIENLKRVSDMLVKEGVTLNIEALNSIVDHKGYYLDSSYMGFEIVKSVNCPNIKLLYDIYHMQIMEGNIIENIRRNIDFIGHFHSAGVPGRNEHFKGESDYPNILKAIRETGYDRYFGLEYWTTYSDKQSISDVLKYLKG
jgi:hydroxypyruvate isomerase